MNNLRGERSIKSEIYSHLRNFIIINILIFISIYIYGKIGIKEFKKVLELITFKDGLVLIIIPIITIIANGILNSNVKSSLVFWKIKNPLPGCRIFSNLALNDSRINFSKIIEKYGQIPQEPSEQNKLWYEIYKKHQEKIIIRESHKNYLLTRDLSGIAFIFLFIIVPSLLFIKLDFKIKIFYSLFLLLQYLIITISARNYGNRFACNVLAEDSVNLKTK